MDFKDLFLNLINWIFLLLLSWALPWSVVGDDCMPGGNLFGIIILVDVCFISGFLVSKISVPGFPPIPSLFGMLLAGFALSNIPVINVARDINPTWSSSLRAIALALILVKAGLGLDLNALVRMKGACIRLTIIPCFVEAATCGVICYLLLGFPWVWGFLLGFVLGAVTPAVVVPSMLKLQSESFGVSKGIPSLVIAASSFDDVLAITGFSAVYSIAFSTVQLNSELDAANISNITTSSASGSLALTIIRSPLEMLGGVVVGGLIGVILWFIPTKKQKNLIHLRTIIIVGVGIFAIFASGRLNAPGAGALIAIITPLVACKKWNENIEMICGNVDVLWMIFEPVMFGLIGAEIRLDELDSSTIGLGVAVLFICLLFRMASTFGAVSFAGFDLKEKIFLCFAWMPKATVQAAIGGLALDRARQIHASDDVIQLASQILTISVLSILITAPLGSVAIGIFGPKLLKKDFLDSKDQEMDELKTSTGDKDA